MKKMNKKYKEVVLEVDKLLDEKKYEEAKNFLSDILNTEYFSYPIYEKLLDKLKIINALIVESKKQKEDKEFINNLNKTDLLKFVIKNSKIDFIFLNLYLEKFKTIDDDVQTEIFSFLLSSSTLRQNEKFELLKFLLIHSKKNYFFVNTIFKISSLISEDFLKKYNDYTKEIKIKTTKKSEKDIVTLNLCLDFISLINLYYFPYIPFEYMKISLNEFITLVYEYVRNQFAQNINKDFDEIINYFSN